VSDRRLLVMDDAEVRIFLGSQRVACVAGQGPNGLTGGRATYVVDGDAMLLEIIGNRLDFDLDRQAKVCISVDTYPSHDEIKGVVVHGTATWEGPRTLRVAIERVVSFDFAKAASP
jgi:hypothetical protein